MVTLLAPLPMLPASVPLSAPAPVLPALCPLFGIRRGNDAAARYMHAKGMQCLRETVTARAAKPAKAHHK